MKTVSDLAAFIKRNGGDMQLSFDGKKFGIGFRIKSSTMISASSTYLDDALENLAEELRRMDSGTVLKENVPVVSSAPTPNNMIAAACGTFTRPEGICPNCKQLPKHITYASANKYKLLCSSSACDREWSATISAGEVYSFRSRYTKSVSSYRLNAGLSWDKVS